MFSGAHTALVTPFADHGIIDTDAFRNLIDKQFDNGISGIVPVGTTGESATLSVEEHHRVIEIAVKQANKRGLVIAGTGSNSTREAVEMTQSAELAGADAALLAMPYYNKPTQEGMYQHYKAVNDAVDLPQVIYNIPGRSVVDMSVETMARCAELPNVIGVKDATADLVRPMKTRLAIDADFTQLSGEDASVVPYLAQGGHGCISVTANVAPRPLAEMHDAWAAGDMDTVQAINERLMPLHDALFCESSPGPVKYAAELLGLCDSATRLPLVEIADSSKQKVESALRSAGLLN